VLHLPFLFKCLIVCSCAHLNCYIQTLVYVPPHSEAVTYHPINIPVTPQWNFPHSGSELGCRDFPLSEPQQRGSVYGISPSRRNCLQVPQMGFHLLRNCDILLPRHSRTLQDKTPGELVNIPRRQPIQNKSNDKAN